MKPFQAGFFLLISTTSGLLYFKGQVATPRSLADDILNDDQQRAKLNDVLTRFEGECVKLGLAACLATVRRLKETLAQGKGNNQQLFFFRR
jgi:hypothetical protein